MDTEDESDTSIPGVITTMASQGSQTTSRETLSLASTPQVSPEVAIVLKNLQFQLDVLKKEKGYPQATGGEEGLAQQTRAALVLRSVDVSDNNRAVKVAMDE